MSKDYYFDLILPAVAYPKQHSCVPGHVVLAIDPDMAMVMMEMLLDPMGLKGFDKLIGWFVIGWFVSAIVALDFDASLILELTGTLFSYSFENRQ